MLLRSWSFFSPGFTRPSVATSCPNTWGWAWGNCWNSLLNHMSCTSPAMGAAVESSHIPGRVSGEPLVRSSAHAVRAPSLFRLFLSSTNVANVAGHPQSVLPPAQNLALSSAASAGTSNVPAHLPSTWRSSTSVACQ